jgi:hypothetical protein
MILRVNWILDTAWGCEVDFNWRVLSHGIQRPVFCWKSTFVLEEHTVSTFRVEEEAKQETSVKKEATCSSETSVDFQRNTRRYIQGDRILHNHSCENLYSALFLHGSNWLKLGSNRGILCTEKWLFGFHTNMKSLGQVSDCDWKVIRTSVPQSWPKDKQSNWYVP